jgi:hypothetical protein
VLRLIAGREVTMIFSATTAATRGRGRPDARPARSSATIKFHEQLRCSVANPTDTGATVYVDQPKDLPLEFRMRIAGESNSLYCAIVRRGLKSVKVVFV